MTPCSVRIARALALAAGLLLASAAPSTAGDVTAFITFPSPSDAWDRGYGAALTSTWFQAIGLEAEAARMPLDSADGTMTSFTGSALLAPPVGSITFYGGLGIGIYRQTLGGEGETSTLRCFILGAKVKLGLLVLRGDYRNLTLSGSPLLEMDKRYSIGAGITF
jgi:hypothetical protein